MWLLDPAIGRQLRACLNDLPRHLQLNVLKFAQGLVVQRLNAEAEKAEDPFEAA